MPSPFPGMDPFIESRVWKDFHTRLVPELANALLPSVRPRYAVRVEERIYLEHSPANDLHSIQPDLAVLQGTDREARSRAGGGAATTVGIAPVLMTLPMPEQEREVFLTVRELQSMEVVTVIELLSPGNKRSGSDGQREYLAKREAVVRSAAHLVELDLLRGGERLPTVQPLPPADYYAFVRRKPFRPQVEVYPWSLRQRLPVIPVPLAGDDPDVLLDLQAVFDTVYDRAGYDYSLDYRHPVGPPLADEDIAWVQQLLTPAPSSDPQR
jgi:Protein of unknown function (DUF4058)